MKHIPEKLYRDILTNVPILCVDGVIGSNGPGPCRFLLVKRTIPPFQGKWWVPGGRVLKGEKLEDAFVRKMREEIGVRFSPAERRWSESINGIHLAGIYQVHHKEPGLNIPGGRHVVSVVFEATLPEGAKITLDYQASEFKWSDRLPRDFRIQEFS